MSNDVGITDGEIYMCGYSSAHETFTYSIGIKDVETRNVKLPIGKYQFTDPELSVKLFSGTDENNYKIYALILYKNGKPCFDLIYSRMDELTDEENDIINSILQRRM